MNEGKMLAIWLFNLFKRIFFFWVAYCLFTHNNCCNHQDECVDWSNSNSDKGETNAGKVFLGIYLCSLKFTHGQVWADRWTSFVKFLLLSPLFLFFTFSFRLTNTEHIKIAYKYFVGHFFRLGKRLSYGFNHLNWIVVYSLNVLP